MQAVTAKVMHKAARAAVSLMYVPLRSRALMCDILASVPELEEMQTTMQGRCSDVLLALRTRNYKLRSLACYFL